MTRVLLLLGIWILLTTTASAADIFGKVIEINDGDTLTISNLNKPVKVQLIGVDAPDGAQPFADFAKQHLSDLILYRSVSVEYSGLVQNNYLLGKVFYRETDIGAQMIRDGVAWFDRSSSERLSDSDKQIYAECEAAARSEKRGLWKDPAPVAPWDFKRQQVVPRPQPAKAVEKPKPVVRLVDNAQIEWHKLTPEGEHFSVMMPGVSYETSVSFPLGTGVQTASCWITDYQGMSYLVLSGVGPNFSYTDETTVEDIARGVVVGLTKSSGLTFESSFQRNLKLNGYFGSEYKLSAPGISGVIRLYSKRVRDSRELYLLGVLNGTDGNPSVEKFLNSLSIGKK